MASFVIGMSHVATIKFIALNVLGALLWAGIISGFGYAFGKAFEALIGDIKHYQLQVMAAIAVFGTLLWLFYKYGRRKHSTATNTSKPPHS